MQGETRRESWLRVGHLVTWIVGCAIGLAAYRSIAPSPEILTPLTMVIAVVYNLAMGMAFGTLLTGCALLARRRWRGDTHYLSRPGHWLLIFGLAAAAADGAAVAAYVHWEVPDPSYPVYPYLAHFIVGGASTQPSMYHQAVGWGLGAIIALVAHLALRLRLDRRWRAVFLVFFLAGAILAVGHIIELTAGPRIGPSDLNFLMVHVYAGCVVAGALAILAALLGDRRSGTPGDGLHRLGVGAWLAIAATQMAMYGLYLAG
jgi:hypothetical protein